MGATHEELKKLSMWEEKQHMIFIIDKHAAISFRDGESRLHIQMSLVAVRDLGSISHFPWYPVTS